MGIITSRVCVVQSKYSINDSSFFFLAVPLLKLSQSKRRTLLIQFIVKEPVVRSQTFNVFYDIQKSP